VEGCGKVWTAGILKGYPLFVAAFGGFPPFRGERERMGHPARQVVFVIDDSWGLDDGKASRVAEGDVWGLGEGSGCWIDCQVEE